MSKSFEEILKNMKAIVNETAQGVSKEVLALAAKVDDNHKEVIAKLSEIEQHIVQPVQKCGAPKTVNTVQYNATANQLKPLGKCLYRGKEENYYGVCKTCGCPIMSPSAVAYCQVNQLDITCYNCQKGGKPKFRAEFLPNDPNAPTATPASTPAPNSNTSNGNVVDISITLPCEICGTPRRYKSAVDYINKSKEAERHGFPKVMCSKCARAKVAEMKAVGANKAEEPQYIESVTDPVKKTSNLFNELLNKCDRTPEVAGWYKQLVKGLEDCTVDDDAVTARKRGLYNAIKDVAHALEIELKKNTTIDDVKTVYHTFIKRAYELVNVVNEVNNTNAESDSSSTEKLSVDDILIHLLTSTNLSAEEIIALKFKDLKELIFEEDLELAFNGNEWNKGKKRAYEIEKAVMGEEVAAANETPSQETTTEETTTDDPFKGQNIGF